jgi:hypothetical protein
MMDKIKLWLDTLIASLVERAVIARGRYQPGHLLPLIKAHIGRNTMRLPRGVIAPNVIEITLDDEAFRRFEPVREILAQELAVSLIGFCEDRAFLTKGPVEIHFDSSPDLETGRVSIDAHISETQS